MLLEKMMRKNCTNIFNLSSLIIKIIIKRKPSNILIRNKKYKGGFLMEERKSLKGHNLNIKERKNLFISGVDDVISFDSEEVLLETEEGALMIRGSELNITMLTLEKGEVNIDGKVNSLTYSDSESYVKNGQSLLNRLFK